MVVDSSAIAPEARADVAAPRDYRIRRFFTVGCFWYPLIVCAFGVLLSWPHLSRRNVLGQDYGFHALRYMGTFRAIADGQLVPQLDPASMGGFGYAPNLFYPPLSAYLVMVMRAITSVLFPGNFWNTAINAAIILTHILAGLTMYAFVRRIVESDFAGLLASLAYMGAPYMLINASARSAAGESLAMVFVPLLFLGLYRITQGERGWLSFAIGLGGLLLSHLLSAVIFTIFAVLFLVFQLLFSKTRFFPTMLRQLLLGGLVAFGISAFFTLPLLEARAAALYNSFVPEFMGNRGIISENAHSSLSSILLPNLDTPYGWLGVAILLALLLAPFVLLRINSQLQALLNTLLILSLIAIVATTAIVPWYDVPEALLVIQFPWRLNMVSTFGLSVIAGIMFANLPSLFWGFGSLPGRGLGLPDEGSRPGLLRSAAACSDDSQSEPIGPRQRRAGYLVSLAVAVVTVLLGAGLAARGFSPHFEDAQATSDANLARTWNLDYVPANSRNYAQLPEGYNVAGDLWFTRQAPLVYEFTRPHEPLALSGNMAFTEFTHYGSDLSFRAEAIEPGLIELPLLFYPGWEATIDGVRVPTYESANGFVALDIPTPGRHQITAHFTMSPATRIGTALTVATLLALATYGIYVIRLRRSTPTATNLGFAK